MVESIFYNLISNALQYRSPERTPLIEITSSQDDRYFMLTVKDNGLGIDLKRHGENVFKIYKRFHPHIEGKGLGLYLVKMQAELLNGRIEVASQVNGFTEFNLFIGVPQNLEEQVLLDESDSKIIYNATLDAAGVSCRGPLASQQFRFTYLKVIEFMKSYNTPNLIIDLTHQGPVDPRDQQWLFTEILAPAIKTGLLRMAAVHPSVLTDDVNSYLKGIKDTLQTSGIAIRNFGSSADARQWISEENEKVVKINS